MKAIKDAVHDHIPIEGVALELLDTPEMQRLRHVRQLGTAYLVYPSANHTRFEHSLGVYHVAREALESLGITGLHRREVLAAALLHDVGHTPFSHNVEDVIEEETGLAHDDVVDVLAGQVSDVLEDHDIDPVRVAELIKGEGRLGQLISGELDVDRMDYLVRDAHHTGVPYGTIDIGRLVNELRFVDGSLALDEGNVQTAEALLIARALMHPTVYNHHVARISKAMLRRAVRGLIDAGTAPDTIRRMNDHELIVAIAEDDATRDLGQRLLERRLYKRAVWAAPETIDRRLEDVDERALERELAGAAGVDPETVIVDRSSPPRMLERKTRVLVGGEIKRLSAASSLVGTLEAVQQDQRRFGVYCPEEAMEDVAEAFERGA